MKLTVTIDGQDMKELTKPQIGEILAACATELESRFLTISERYSVRTLAQFAASLAECKTTEGK